MHLSASESCQSLVLLCILLRSSHGYKNGATELLYPHVSAPVPVPEVQNNVTMNRARNGGRGEASATQDRGERGQIGCRELRSTKYISDGHCTSINPIKELVCTGECLPAHMLQNWIGGTYSRKLWGRRGNSNHNNNNNNQNNNQDWRCVNDKTRTQRIQLQCQDGSTRTYKITVVTSCKCKRYSRQHNESGNKFEETSLSPPQILHKHNKSKSKRRLGKNQLGDN